MFVRNNGIPSVTDNVEPLGWELQVTGEACLQPARLTLGDLKQRFAHQTLQLQIECGGNGRAEFHPPAITDRSPTNQRSLHLVKRDLDFRETLARPAIVSTAAGVLLATRRRLQPASVHLHLTDVWYMATLPVSSNAPPVATPRSSTRSPVSVERAFRGAPR